MRQPKCPCEYCDPLLWAQAHSDAGTRKAANVVALLADLVRDALHPTMAAERRAEGGDRA